MSRSIHDTRRFLYEALHDDYSDLELQRELIHAAQNNLRRQRSIKDHVRQQREAGALVVPPLDPERVPILTSDHGPFVHHQATQEDLREVMRRLPPGSLDGLTAIHLCLSSEETTEHRRTCARDPYTSRPGQEILPGVYAAPVLSAYRRADHSIRLFAFVHVAGAPGVAAIVLKLRALTSFLYEAARHFHFMFRISGDRWRADDQDRTESYIYRTASEHTSAHLIPYLEDRYSSECAALRDWMRHHGGVAVPMTALSDNWQRRPRAARDMPTLRALLALLFAVAAGQDPMKTRVGFARALHRAGHHDFAMAALARVLAEHPGHADAHSVRACIAACRGELDLAESTCRAVLVAAPRCAEAWAVLSHVYLGQGRWEDLAACATSGLDLAQHKSEEHRRQLEHRMRAYLELGRWDALAQDIASLQAWGTNEAGRAVAVFSVLQLCRRQRWAEALAEASRLLRLPGFAGAAAELSAVRFESAHRLGRPREGGPLTERQAQSLQAQGYRAWVDRLVAECGLIPIRRRTRSV